MLLVVVATASAAPAPVALAASNTPTLAVAAGLPETVEVAILELVAVSKATDEPEPVARIETDARVVAVALAVPAAEHFADAATRVPSVAVTVLDTDAVPDSEVYDSPSGIPPSSPSPRPYVVTSYL